jgi:hypothetical protein
VAEGREENRFSKSHYQNFGEGQVEKEKAEWFIALLDISALYFYMFFLILSLFTYGMQLLRV